MSSGWQLTLRRSAFCAGIGLHSGKPVQLVILPAPVDSGIVFVREDLPNKPVIPALSEKVLDTSLATTLGHEGAHIGTVEHLMAALRSLGIDNARIEVNGPELPILDGSAAPFVSILQEAGLREQEVPKTYMVIKKTITVRSGDKFASLAPASEFWVDCTVDFQHPLIMNQTFGMRITPESFMEELARARTFCFLQDVEQLKQVGLAQGGSLENAIVVDKFSILNPEGLRFPDEFVRHKFLDVLGDLALLGKPLLAHMTAYKTGHTLNQQLVQAVLSDANAFELLSLKPEEANCGVSAWIHEVFSPSPRTA
ncbi:MAG: UDP-3-O-acyl-N-acetylglucosamine deacetylase [Cystobacterineae bacterium]|nr:UDP-3-O-acyl-N-acetylglucosamine deacetylase [Cystobacterineae bacterium]